MKQTKTITILHSNDLHGDFLAEQVDEKLVGGVSMLSGYIEKVRAEQPNTIYAIAGDMFRGSVIDSEYKGLSTIEIMNALAPDIVTIGNHEVDYGIAHLLFIEKCARFPIINANLYIKNTPTRLFTPYKILRMDGMNILFIGIITQDVINQTKSESLVGSFVDTAAAAAEVGKICNAHNSIDIDFTVLLTHIGFEEDRHLARQLDPAWGVDLIIGGHSHTLPEHAVEENGVVIAQAGTGTDQIGRFDIIVDTDNNCIDSYTWHTVPISAETCPRNPAMEQVLHRFTSQVDEKYSHIVGRFRRELTHPQRTQETELGNLFADIFTRSLGVDVMLIGSGSIRAEKLGPIVTYGDLIEGFPYDDGVFMFKVTGQQLRQMLHYMLREEAYTGHTEFYQLPSTLRLRYDRRKGDFDYFTYCGREVGKEIGDDALFTVGLQNYHFKNIESFFNISYDTLCKLQKPRSVATSCQDMLRKLNCANNQLTQLNLNNMISLTELNCANNQLTVLDVSSSPNLTTLWLKNNQLTSLNLDNNPNLNFTYTDFYNSDFNNVYTVTLNPDRTFDLSTLPGGFDINRVTEWVNGTVKGNILTVNDGTNVVYYGYQCITGGMMDASFTLDVTGTGGTVPPVTPPSGGDNPGGGSTPGGSTGGGDGGGAVVIVAAAGAAAAGVVGYGVYNYVSGRKLQALLPEGVAAPENRAQTALLLWNTAGRPEPADAPAFADVADPDTAKAAQWCVEQGLMKRRLNGKFAPDSSIPAYQVLNAYRKLAG